LYLVDVDVDASVARDKAVWKAVVAFDDLETVDIAGANANALSRATAISLLLSKMILSLMVIGAKSTLEEAELSDG